MRSVNFKTALLKSALAPSVLLLAGGTAIAQQQVNLTARTATTTLPDGTVVPMWNYLCGAAVTGSTASCTALNPAVQTANTTPPTGYIPGSAWSPVVITVPVATSGATSLQINLTNSLPSGVPTSLTIVGQLGGGLGTPGGTTLRPDHTKAQTVTWPIADPTTAGAPPAQGPRVQSFGTEVAVSATATALTWSNLKPGTYLIESGTHPSIQGPMGLFGILVVTTAPSATTPGTAYPAVGSRAAVTYSSEIPLLFSEIDPVQNAAVTSAVGTTGFLESNVWAGFSGPSNLTVLCRTVSGGTASNGACYPPAVNYTPLYYLINGVALDKTHVTNSVFAAVPGSATTAVTGTVLVRLVNAGLRMHVPSIVGAQMGTATAPALPPAGFSLIAEDGNVLPGVPRVQSEVFMAAGKTNDVMINVPVACTPTPCTTPALPVYDRELSLSSNATSRDAGMLAYLGINGGVQPTTAATTP